MDQATIVALVAGITSGVAAALISGVVTLRKVRADLAAQYDSEVRKKRIEHYTAIWEMFVATTIGPRSFVTRGQLESLSLKLRDWYFGEAGMYLSADSAEVYGLLQQELARLIAREGGEDLTEEDQDRVRRLASAFRVSMTEDIGTRRTSPAFKEPMVKRFRRRALYRRLRSPRSGLG
jgi:hypothetical protein